MLLLLFCWQSRLVELVDLRKFTLKLQSRVIFGWLCGFVFAKTSYHAATTAVKYLSQRFVNLPLSFESTICAFHSSYDVHTTRVKVWQVTTHVQDIELDRALRAPVEDFEIKPVRVTSSVGVDLQQQVILLDVDKVSGVEIARFEVGIELQQHLLVDVAWQLCLFFLGDVVVLIPAELYFVGIFAYKEVQIIARHLECLGFVCLVNSVLKKLGVEWGVNWGDLLDLYLVRELCEHVLRFLEFFFPFNSFVPLFLIDNIKVINTLLLCLHCCCLPKTFASPSSKNNLSCILTDGRHRRRKFYPSLARAWGSGFLVWEKDSVPKVFIW